MHRYCTSPNAASASCWKQLYESTDLSVFEMFRNFPMYLSGPTVKDHTDMSTFNAAGVRLELKGYQCPEYPPPFGARRTQR